MTADPTPSTDVLSRYADSLLGVFGTPQLALVSGEGSWVTDADGKQYLDLLGGIAVNALGHAHPALVAAITRQANALIHVSNFFTSEPAVALGEALLDRADAPAGSRVFFTNSGTEAIEAAVKLSRRTGRTKLVALTGAFHGRSTGALALTHKPVYREPFAPLMSETVFIPPNDVAALEAALDDETAALFLEPIQGEAGVRPLDDEYLQAARALTTAHGALLIVDEIQTGIGRTGAWFAHTASGIVPDAMTLAKGLAGGVPIGALVTFGPEVSALLQPGQHGTTFGGNPLATAAGLAVLQAISDEGLLDHADKLGHHVLDQQLDGVLEIRGRGLLLGFELAQPVAAQVVALAREAGFIVNAPTPTTLRIAPALNLEAADLAAFLAALPGLIQQAAGAGTPS